MFVFLHRNHMQTMYIYVLIVEGNVHFMSDKGFWKDFQKATPLQHLFSVKNCVALFYLPP